MELSDYKAGLQAARRELQECRQSLADRDALVSELSARIAEVTESKEERAGEARQLQLELGQSREELQGLKSWTKTGRF